MKRYASSYIVKYALFEMFNFVLCDVFVKMYKININKD